MEASTGALGLAQPKEGSALSLTGHDASTTLDRDPVNGRYKSKHTDSRIARVKRVAERLAQLRATYMLAGPSDDATLSIVAHLFVDAEAARSRISRVRCINAATRLLRTLKRREAPAAPTNLKAFGL